MVECDSFRLGPQRSVAGIMSRRNYKFIYKPYLNLSKVIYRKVYVSIMSTLEHRRTYFHLVLT